MACQSLWFVLLVTLQFPFVLCRNNEYKNYNIFNEGPQQYDNATTFFTSTLGILVVIILISIVTLCGVLCCCRQFFFGRTRMGFILNDPEEIATKVQSERPILSQNVSSYVVVHQNPPQEPVKRVQLFEYQPQPIPQSSLYPPVQSQSNPLQ